MESHHTHNISCSSSEAQYNINNKNNESSSSSPEKDIYERSKSINDWSNLLLNNNINPASLRIIEESDLDITARSYESNYNPNGNEELMKNENLGSKSKSSRTNMKNNGYIKKFNFKNKYIYDRFGKKFRVLNNGIILRKMNKRKKVDEHPFKRNEFIISNKKRNYTNKRPFKNNAIQNKMMKEMNYQKPDPKINLLLLQKAQKEERRDTFHIIYIKKPNRSFVTKVYKYKDQPNKKSTASSGMFSKIRSYSSRMPASSSKLLAKRKEMKSKMFSNNYNNIIPKLIENNTDIKLDSLSTTSNKKFSINSNASIFLNRSNNLKKNTFLQKRPSSVIAVRKEINLNYKAIKKDNYDVNIYNKSYNPKFIPSIGSTNGNKSMKSRKNDNKSNIYENMNFAQQLKELKTAFEFYSKKNQFNINNIDNYTDNKHQKYKLLREHLNNNNLEDYNSEKIITRKLNSAKIKNSSYHMVYPQEISPLYKCNQAIKFVEEEEKQTKLNCFHNKFGYQKHFGNENSCPVCTTLKENNLLREEILSNKNYYFPFKDKNEENHISLTSKCNHSKSYNNIFKKNKDKVDAKYLNNPYCINNKFIDPTIRRKRNLMNEQNYKALKKNKSNMFNNYDALQNYFL